MIQLFLHGTGAVLSLLKKYWKFVIVAVALIALFIVHQNYVRAFGEAQFRKGVDATLQKVKTEVSKRNEVNRALEKESQSDIDDFAAEKAKDAAKRHVEEAKSQKKIETVVESLPMWKSKECAVTSQVIEERNAIRALGPQNEEETK